MKETVLISGATGGIGSACARRFAADGFPVVMLFHTDAATADVLVQEITTKGGKAVAYQADVTDADRIQSVVKEAEVALGPIGIVVHAATAPLQVAGIREVQWESYQQHWEVAVHGAHNLGAATLSGMEKRGHGNMVFFLTAALSQPPAGWSAYLAAKAALGQYAESIRHELGRSGVHIHTVAPAFVDTALTAGLPDVFKRIAREQPGATTPEAVAEQVVQLVTHT